MIKWMIARRISFSVCIGGCNSSLLTASSPATGLNMGPPAGNGAELQFAFAPFHAPELAGLELVFQILCGLEQRGFERVVSGLGVQGRAMNQQRSLARVPGGLGVYARAGYLQPHLDAECRSGFQLVFEDNLGGGDRRQAMQVFELFLHLALPSGLGVEGEVSKRGFHIRLDTGEWLQRAHGVLCGDDEHQRPCKGRAESPPASPRSFRRR